MLFLVSIFSCIVMFYLCFTFKSAHFWQWLRMCVYALVLRRICVVFVCMCVAYPELHVLCCVLRLASQLCIACPVSCFVSCVLCECACVHEYAPASFWLCLCFVRAQCPPLKGQTKQAHTMEPRSHGQFSRAPAFHAAKAHKEGLTWLGAGHGYFPQFSEN